MDIIKIINEEIRNNFSEAINLDVSKGLRNYQKKQIFDTQLEEIFGKNVYRLYYDLKTGKQIQPTRKTPKFKLDIPIVNRLKDDIESTLETGNYSIVDFEKNVAKNNNNNQQIKISKILPTLNKYLANKYNTYLTQINQKIDENDLCVVISRHAHDIGEMSAKPNITSCEDIRDVKTFKELMSNVNADFGEGNGTGLVVAINRGELIFYLINEGDWNINNPLSRLLGANLCGYGNYGSSYGKFSNQFVDFVSEWISRYELKVSGKKNWITDINFYKKDRDTIANLINQSFQEGGYDNDQYKQLLIGVVKNKRFDVLEFLLKTNPTGWVNTIANVFGIKGIATFPEEIQKIIKETVEEDFSGAYNKIRLIYDSLFNDFEKTKIFGLAKKIGGGIAFASFKDTIHSFSLDPKEIPFQGLSKYYFNDRYNNYNQILTKLRNRGDYGIIYDDFLNYMNKIKSIN